MGWGIDAIIEPVLGIATKFLADRADGEHRALLGGAEAAAKPHQGWASAAASAACVSAWQARLHRLSTEADNVANAVTKSMDTYVDADKSAADELRKQAEWFER